ncbi:MAG: phosphoenolpyruvate synthase [Pseudomonadota bacterium]
MTPYIIWFDHLCMQDVPVVGGKNASLGEMIGHLVPLGIRVPNGFATTAAAYRDFLSQNGLDRKIAARLEGLDVFDVTALARAGLEIRRWIVDEPLPARLVEEIGAAYKQLDAGAGSVSYAVRSSATAEDLQEASFAGQQETLLNVSGLENVLYAVREVFASLYNDRAIAYRVHQGFDHRNVALSAGIQRMVRSDRAASGVMFTLDTESGFDQVVFITAAYGLGETVVQGAVNPDEFYVYKPSLAQGKRAVIRRNLGGKAIRMVFDEAPHQSGRYIHTEPVPAADRTRFSIIEAEAEELARYAMIIERHYGRPMDIEWGKDGLDGKLYILQARPETVQARNKFESIQRYRLKTQSEVLMTGRAIGQKIGGGHVCLVRGPAEMHRVQPGDVLVADMTDPDWEPVMKRASSIVTNRGGRTCHAAIVARELGIPAVVGCGNATDMLKHGEEVTVSCAEGDIGKVYRGLLEIEVSKIELTHLPQPPVKISMNVANPELAFELSRLPNHGIGLARLEFIIARMIGIHPQAALDYPDVPQEVQEELERRSAGYATPADFYVDKLAEGIATLGAAFAPKPVIVRLSDFKSNEYSSLAGGKQYEPTEENPMIGFRGASRYIDPKFAASFALECRAMRRVRDEMGLTNVEVMIPFVRTLEEAKGVITELEKNGLRRGENGLRVIMMCEIPSNALMAHDFLQYFDGFSIGSNDLTQLTLGIDRDSGIVAGGFDERNPAVTALISMAIQGCRKEGKYIGICGQGPSDHPDLARWLVGQGIEAISLNPDTVLETWLYLSGDA